MIKERSAIEKCIEYTKGCGDVPPNIFVAAERELAELVAIKNRVFNDKDCRYCKHKNKSISRKPCNQCTGLSENWEYDANATKP
jgi:hypothetical protein